MTAVMMIGTNMKVFNKSCVGESHIADQKPCQDHSISYQSDTGISIAVVSDGHGGKPYFRSHIGSEVVCNVTLDAIKTFVDCVDASYFTVSGKDGVQILPLTAADHPGRLSVQEESLRQLSKTIILKWRNAVADHAANTELTEWEKSHVEKEYLDQICDPDKLFRAYGCTLMAFVVTPQYWFALHLGDGKCFAFYDKNANKIWDEPLPWDERCFLNKTTSICTNDAYESFRFAYGGQESKPIAIFLGSDGIDDTFCDNESLSDFYIKILKEIMFTSEDEVVRSLEDDLPVLSRRGSRDDMSVACIYDEERVAESIGAILEFQITLVKSRMDASDKRINELISRKQDLEHYLEVRDSWFRWRKEKEELEKKLGISSSTNIDIEMGFADRDIEREKTARQHLNRKQDSLVNERGKIQEVEERLKKSALTEPAAIEVVELVDSVPVVAEDPVEPIQKSADTSLSSDEKSDAPVVTECKGLTHEEPHYINPVPSQPKEDAK